MGRSIKCPKCQLWFSAEKYSTCPHCIEIAEEQALKKSKEQMITNAVVAYLRSEEAAKKEAEPKAARLNAKKENENPALAEPVEEGLVTETPRSEAPRSEAPATEASVKEVSVKNAFTKEEKAKAESKKSFLRTDMPEFLKPNKNAVPERKTEPENEEAPRAMGWLLCVRGPKFGESIPVQSGRMLFPQEHPCAVFVSDCDSGKVFLYPGVAGSMCSRNEEKVNDAMLLEEYDRIVLGSDPEQLYLFIPLCGDRFNWREWPKNN